MDVFRDVSTQNIVGSRSSTVPHWRYLTGYRYATRYVYRATESFEEFISTERTTVILRNVTFDCSDDSSVRVHFRFPLKDENEAPEFTAYPSGNIDVNLTEVEESTIINEGILITVRDKDWTPEYNSVDVTSDRRELIITETTESPIDVGKRYDVNLKLNLTDRENIAEGVYSINLICTDGEFTDTARIKINIFK